MDFNGILQGIKNMFAPQQNQEIISPLPANETMTEGLEHYYKMDAMKQDWARRANQERAGQPTPTPQTLKYPDWMANAPKKPVAKAPAPQGQVLSARNTNPVTEEQIRAGWDSYGDGNAPAATASATFAEVANQYPVLRENPGLLPAMAMKETSGGKASGGKIKNWFNWGIYDDGYQETDPNQVIRDVAAAIAGEDSPSSHYYEKFRKTGNVRDMLDRYAPPTENDTALYHKQLLDWIEMFQ